ncbi:MAG: putative rane protein of unknown function [Pedosphaera sp.]|nr:putative rane protein of unknown function [Pedosphaera sp.]
MLPFGLLPLSIGLWQLKRGIKNRSWSVTEGTITESRVMERGVSYRYFDPQVSYEYQVGPNRYTSSRINEGGYSFGSDFAARTIIKRYRPDKKARVSYNPNRPEQSVLEPGPTFGTYVWLFIGCLFTFICFAANY